MGGLKYFYHIDNFCFSYPYSDRIISFPGSNTIDCSSRVLVTGDSGSGKSTLLYALKGLVPEFIYGRTSGKLTFNGKNIDSLNHSELMKIGLLLQNPDSQMITGVVLDELAFGLENLGLKRFAILDRILNFAERFKVTHLLNRTTSTLSGGEKQKIAIMSLALTEPVVYLLDEPTAFLDPNSAEDIAGFIKNNPSNSGYIIVEHNIGYFKDSVDMVYRIHDDLVVPAEIANLYSKDFTLNRLSIADEGRTILELNRVSFGYAGTDRREKHEVLNSLTLEIRQRSIVGISGINGAGKSTLLKIMARLIKPDSGRLKYMERDIGEYSQRDYYRQVSILFQNPENHFLFDTVSREVSFNNDILESFGLSWLADRNPFTLSEGEKRRLSLCIVINSGCKLILMDEPTFGLDTANKNRLIEIMSKLSHDDITFIIVSHDIEFLNAVCNRNYKLSRGKLILMNNEQDKNNPGNVGITEGYR